MRFPKPTEMSRRFQGFAATTRADQDVAAIQGWGWREIRREANINQGFAATSRAERDVAAIQGWGWREIRRDAATFLSACTGLTFPKPYLMPHVAPTSVKGLPRLFASLTVAQGSEISRRCDFPSWPRCRVDANINQVRSTSWTLMSSVDNVWSNPWNSWFESHFVLCLFIDSI